MFAPFPHRVSEWVLDRTSIHQTKTCLKSVYSSPKPF
nr:MAG TPA: hypothetical protein [Caudoviricetes sp.]DAQ91702.1 MAG TPA: hypothetical protein [Caudoviricetes sp.]